MLQMPLNFHKENLQAKNDFFSFIVKESYSKIDSDTTATFEAGIIHN
jgi:hypothetical protein